MAIFVANCPRCDSARMTFDVLHTIPTGMHYQWQRWYEVFCVCRNCRRSTTFVLAQESIDDGTFLTDHEPTEIDGSLNPHFRQEGFICLKDMGAEAPPENVPEGIAKAFSEGATSLATNCFNAAGAMFRLAIDLTTRPMLPTDEVEGLNNKTRRDLGLRLPWLFANGKLPADLQELAKCVREDGNDGAHQGSLERSEAEDLLDFTRSLLERIFTEPARIAAAQRRRDERRSKAEKN